MDINTLKKVFEEHTPKPIGTHRYYSVLVPFVERDDKLHILYEVRAKNMNSQPGEICFPGGMIEANEGPKEAAIRESCEELGINWEKIEIIGSGDILYGYANYTIFTYIGVIREEDYLTLNPSPNEVEEVFLVDAEKLCKNPPERHEEKVVALIDEHFPYFKLGVDESYPWKTGKWIIPIYEVDNRVIWGLTARITDNVLGYLNCEYRE
ncbi:NUDIX domain-containing protein [Peptostreptococcaceae bacterium pGA-8]|nr:NUDIX domain-containing protein [Peptostreptococcaceae bacterium pGA-8]